MINNKLINGRKRKRKETLILQATIRKTKRDGGGRN